MDVGNRWGILTGTSGVPDRLRRVPRVFAGLGDDSGDDAPDIGDSPGLDEAENPQTSDAAVNTTVAPISSNPGEPITGQSDPNMTAASSSSGGGSSSSTSSGGGSSSPSIASSSPAASTNYLPWIIGGAAALGVGAAVYLHRRKLHRRR